MNTLHIDPEFQSLIPPLSKEERELLEKSILSEGCRDPLVVWQNGKLTLIDGHNRYEICQRNGIEFKTQEKNFSSKDDVKVWIIKNQFGRRNLSAYDRSKLALQMEDVISKKARENLVIAGKETHSNQHLQPCQKSDNPAKVIKPVDTKKEIAKVAGVSHDTIVRVKKIEEKATPEIKQQLKDQKISINQAYKQAGLGRQEKSLVLILQPGEEPDFWTGGSTVEQSINPC